MRTDKPATPRAAKAATPTSVLDLLARDHREVDLLFERVADAKADAARDAAFGALKEALTTHARLEETIVYPAFRTTSDERLWVAASAAYADHREGKVVLAELSSLPSGSDRFAQRLQELKTRVSEHVGHEEGEIFRLAKDALGVARLEALGQRWEASRAPRPRPGASSKG